VVWALKLCPGCGKLAHCAKRLLMCESNSNASSAEALATVQAVTLLGVHGNSWSPAECTAGFSRIWTYMIQTPFGSLTAHEVAMDSFIAGVMTYSCGLQQSAPRIQHLRPKHSDPPSACCRMAIRRRSCARPSRCYSFTVSTSAVSTYSQADVLCSYALGLNGAHSASTQLLSVRRCLTRTAMA
jgi:hypothetical protein